MTNTASAPQKVSAVAPLIEFLMLLLWIVPASFNATDVCVDDEPGITPRYRAKVMALVIADLVALALVAPILWWFGITNGWTLLLTVTALHLFLGAAYLDYFDYP